MEEENLPQQNQTPLRRPVRYFAVEETKERESEQNNAWHAMSVAIFIDIIEFILGLVAIGEVLNSIITIAANLMFFIWFWTLEVKYTASTKLVAIAFIQVLVGLIPFLNLLPELSLGVLAIALITRSEDKGGLLGKVASVAQGKIKV